MGVNAPRNPIALQEWLTTLTNMKSSWPTRGWSFDNRFDCLASTFRKDVAPQARTAIAQVLPTEWAEASLKTASHEIREIGRRTGGVRAGQLLYTRALGGPLIAYGLWWPWEEGSTFSFRIGVDGAGDVTLSLCAAMGIEP